MVEPLPVDPEDRDDGAGPPGGWSGGRRTVLLGLAVAVAVVAGAALASFLTKEPAAGPDGNVLGPGSQLLENRPAADEQMPLPDVTLEGFGEGAPPVDLTAYRGRPLVVNFWASWCAPCVAEMPHFQEFSTAAGDTVALLGVNVQDAPRNARAFVERLGITYDLAKDPDGALYAAVRGFGMPTTLFVDGEGTIVFRRTGLIDLEQLYDLADRHLGVPIAPRG